MLDDAIKRLVDEVAEAAGGVGGGAVMQRAPHERDIMGLFDRCRSTFGAIRLLAKVEDPNFGQEALILCRPVITESLMLMELPAADETHRASLVVGWQLRTLDDLAGLFAEAESRGEDVSAQVQGIAGGRREVEEYARSRGASTRMWRVDRSCSQPSTAAMTT